MANHPDSQDLPELIQQYIKNLAKRIRNRHMRRDVIAELIAHFTDALAEAPGDCDREELAASLIGDFGDTKSLGRLIKRAKKRCRPLWVKFIIRTCQTILVLLLIFAGYTYWFFTGKPTIKVDYLAKLNEMVRPVVDESLNAAPYYHKACELFLSPSELEEREVKNRMEFSAGGRPTRLPPRESTLGDIRNLVDHPGSTLKPEQRQALNKWIEANQPAIDQLRLGTAKPYCWFRYRVYPEAEESMLINVLLPYIQRLHGITNALRWQTQFSAEDGHWNSIADDLKSIKMVARHLMGCPFLIEHLFGIVMDERANKQLIHLLRSYRLPPSALQRLAQTFDGSFPSGYPIADVGRESVNLLDIVQRVFTDNGSGDGHLIPFALERFMSVSGARDMSDGAIDLVMAVVHTSRRETVQLIEQWKQRAQQYRSATPYQNHVSGYSIAAWTIKIREENPGNFLFKMLVPATQRAVWISYRGQAQHQAAQTIVALLRYKADHGQFPETLDKLIPQYLNAVPLDPFGPGPLTYKRQDDDFLLYSFGFDFRDNGGKRGHRMEQDVDSVFWPPEPVQRP